MKIIHIQVLIWYKLIEFRTQLTDQIKHFIHFIHSAHIFILTIKIIITTTPSNIMLVPIVKKITSHTPCVTKIVSWELTLYI